MTKVSYGLAAILFFAHCLSTLFFLATNIPTEAAPTRMQQRASAIVAAKGADIETLSQLLHLSTNCPLPLPIKTQ